MDIMELYKLSMHSMVYEWQCLMMLNEIAYGA